MTKTITTVFTVTLLVTILMGSLILSQTAFAGASESNKTTICHVDKKTGEEETISVSSPSVVRHLTNHGDYTGDCQSEPFTCMECQTKFSETLELCDLLKSQQKNKCIATAVDKLTECNSLCTAEIGETFEILKSDEFVGIVSQNIVSADSSVNHVVSSGGQLDGVGKFTTNVQVGNLIGIGTCSSSLLADGIHVLTAAHCVDGFISGTVTFNGDLRDYTHTVTKVDVHPSWNGSPTETVDLAILTLDGRIHPDIERYAIDKNDLDDVNSIGQHVGFGLKGTGDTGAILGTEGTKRDGLNKYDSAADRIFNLFGKIPTEQLHYDFDNGLAANDAFGLFFELNDLGLGSDKEVMSAQGDSGGPSFNSEDEIMGVTSYGLFLLQLTDGTKADINSITDSTFGEIGGDVRVSKYASFIEGFYDPPVVGGVIVNLDIVDPGTDVIYTWGAGQFTGTGTPATCTIIDDVFGTIKENFVIGSTFTDFTQTHTINQETTNTATLTCVDQWGHTWIQQASQTVEIAPDLATCQAACVTEEAACDQSGAQPSPFTCSDLGFFCDNVCTDRNQETCEDWCILRGNLCTDLGNDQIQCNEGINTCISDCSPVQ